MSSITRRAFVAGTAAGLAGAASWDHTRAASANDVLRIAIVGSGGRHQSYIPELAKRNDIRVVAVCDVDESRREKAAADIESALGSRPTVVADYRRVVDNRDVDVAFVATPHHWHCPIAVPLVLSGKDVYVEKPASHVLREGRLLVDAAAKQGRIVQHGTQMRSSEVTAKAGEVLASGLLGEIKMSKAWNVQRHSHSDPVPDSDPPPGVDYDMWLGPAASRAFNPKRFHGGWQWFREYGNGDIGNDGAHDIDMARWGLGVTTHPVRITSHGSRIDLTGEREYPDNMMVAYQYANDKVLLYEDRGWTKNGMYGFDSGNAFYGSEGTMIFSRRGYFQVYLGQQNEEGPGMKGGAGMEAHVANFLDCVRSRQATNADAMIAHLSCALCHLGEIGYRVGRVLEFDPQTERITNDAEADALLTKEYRQPWSLPASV